MSRSARRETLEMAARLARFAGARPEAVMVLSPEHAEAHSSGMMARAYHDSDVAEDIAARDPDVLYQDPGDGHIAASERLDLLVMGSAAHGPAGAVALVGVARRVTASADCPLLVLSRDAEGQIE